MYNGRASDKQITLASGFLDKLDEHDMVQADKGFNIVEHCAARHIHINIPPGLGGSRQMTAQQNKKTTRIANRRFSVEQVIRRLKSFRIKKTQVPVRLIPG